MDYRTSQIRGCGAELQAALHSPGMEDVGWFGSFISPGCI